MSSWSPSSSPTARFRSASSTTARRHRPEQRVIETVGGNGAGADDLAKTIDLGRDAVGSTGPDSEIEGGASAPQNRVRVDIRRARIADNVAGIVDRRRLGGEESRRYRQLLDPRHTARVGDVVCPDDRIEIALAGDDAGVIDCVGFRDDLTAQGANIDQLPVAPQERAIRRTNLPDAHHMSDAIDAVGLAVVDIGPLTQEPEIGGQYVLVLPDHRVGRAAGGLVLRGAGDLADSVDGVRHDVLVQVQSISAAKP